MGLETVIVSDQLQFNLVDIGGIELMCNHKGFVIIGQIKALYYRTAIIELKPDGINGSEIDRSWSGIKNESLILRQPCISKVYIRNLTDCHISTGNG